MALTVPTLNQLRCFEAAAHHESFTSAANELCLTPSAISHQIRTLEAALHVDLFVRLGRKMSLSEAGRRLLSDIQPAFGLIEGGVRRLTSSTRREVLTIGAPPSFAEAWLIPNLSRFRSFHTEVEVRLVTTAGDMDPERSPDCEIRYGHGKWIGMQVEKIAEDMIVPLASPRLAGIIESEGISALAQCVLVQTESRPFTWEDWFGAEGYAPPANPMRFRVDRSQLAIKAAINDLGIALESSVLAAREIKDGSLVPLVGLLRSGGHAEDTYFLVRSRSRGSLSRSAAFARWILNELAPDVDGSPTTTAPTSARPVA